jgi:hypothetical protein
MFGQGLLDTKARVTLDGCHVVLLHEQDKEVYSSGRRVLESFMVNLMGQL